MTGPFRQWPDRLHAGGRGRVSTGGPLRSDVPQPARARAASDAAPPRRSRWRWSPMRAKDAVGRYGENVAATYLARAGWQLLDRNWRGPAGELDIVALQGTELVVVEVKTRSGDGFGHPAVVAAVAAGCPQVVVPLGNAEEARLVPGADVRPATHLAEVARWYGADVEVPDVEPVRPEVAAAPESPVLDMSDVLGQRDARWALEVAAAGGHHVLMVGPPGAGKTMLAARLPGLLPDLGEREAVEVTAVHSVAGIFCPTGGLLRRPPFED